MTFRRVRSQLGPAWRRLIGTAAAFTLLLGAVVAFTDGYSGGDLLIDGPGVSMWLRLLLVHGQASQSIPTWTADIWSGTSMWDLVSSFHLVVLLPVANLVGTDEAVKLGIVGAQVAGAWGAFVLARSLWQRTWAAVVAGVLYGLHPFFASHGPLSGHEPTVWVFAATPWLAWSLRLALRRRGPEYTAVAGLIVGLAILEQAELAYSLALMCGVLVILELCRAHRGATTTLRPRDVALRAVGVVGIGLGITAHWLVPFVTKSKEFVLTPPREVRMGLDLVAGGLGRRPAAFVHRPEALHGTYGVGKLGQAVVASSGFYLGTVCVFLTGLTILLLTRQNAEDDGTLPALLLASALGVWMSMGRVSLASGGLSVPSAIPVLVGLGVVIGLIVGTFQRRLQLGRVAPLATAGAALGLFVLPFVSPIWVGERLFPFLESIRFPRLYSLAALGVALGGCYPLTVLQGWLERRTSATPSRLLALVVPVVSLVVMAAFVVDVAPYRSYYRLRSPEIRLTGSQASALAQVRGSYRVATPNFDEPTVDRALLETGPELSVGWPHPAASAAVWRLTAEAMRASPTGYRDRALGLSATAYTATVGPTVQIDGGRDVRGVAVEANPQVLPLVRAYEQVLVVNDSEVTPELAVALAGRNIGVVGGDRATEDRLSRLDPSVVASPKPCDERTRPPPGSDTIRGEVAMACAIHTWVGTDAPGLEQIRPDTQVGSILRSPVPGLRGVAVWLAGSPDDVELSLREVGEDKSSVGREIARGHPAGTDENGMTIFAFDPQPQSENRNYAFLLSCRQCPPVASPAMFVAGVARGTGNLVLGDHLDPERAVAFAPVFDHLAPADPPQARLTSTRPAPGRWRIEVDDPKPALIVVAESHFSGWEATVDGKPAPVVTADGGFLGVPVDGGHHEVTLVYHRSRAAVVGRALTLVTIVVALVLVCPPLRHRIAGLRRGWRSRREGSVTPELPRTRSAPPTDRQKPGATPRGG